MSSDGPIRVLVVDDEGAEDIADRLNTLPVPEGARPIEADWVAGVVEFADALEARPAYYDVCVVDIVMPNPAGDDDVCGYYAVTRMREITGTAQAVMLTVYGGDPARLTKAMHAGAYSYVCKEDPDCFKLLPERIRAAAERKHALEEREHYGRQTAFRDQMLFDFGSRLSTILDFVQRGLDDAAGIQTIFTAIDEVARPMVADFRPAAAVAEAEQPATTANTASVSEIVQAASRVIETICRQYGIRYDGGSGCDISDLLAKPPLCQVIVYLGLRAATSASGRDANGRVKFECKCGPKTIELRITDNGPQLPDDQVAGISDPVLRASLRSTRPGMYRCITLVELCNGKLSVSSTAESTTFTMVFARRC